MSEMVATPCRTIARRRTLASKSEDRIRYTGPPPREIARFAYIKTTRFSIVVAIAVMPYAPATLRRTHDIERVERVGADILLAQGVVPKTSLKWHFSVLGCFQWATTIAMLVMMTMVKNDVEALHSALHGGDDEAIKFNIVRHDVAAIYASSLTAAQTGGAEVAGLPGVLAHINGMLHTNADNMATMSTLMSHMNDAESGLQVDMAAFVEHHAEDVECTDCLENLATALAVRNDDNLHDCGNHYCVPFATQRFDSASACADAASATDPSVHKDATCFNLNTVVDCTGTGYVATKFLATDSGYTGQLADCPLTCVHTPGTACGDHTPTVAADGTGTCAAAFKSTDLAVIQECVVTGYKLWGTTECAASLYPTDDDAAAAGAPCNSNCRGYNFATNTGCFNATALGVTETTGDAQFEKFLGDSCTAATGAASGTAPLFGEDHFRSHTLCAAADLAVSNGAATAAALIVAQTTSGARGACRALDFCR